MQILQNIIGISE